MTDNITIPLPAEAQPKVADASPKQGEPAAEPVIKAESVPASEGSEPEQSTTDEEVKQKRKASGRIAELYAGKKQAEADAAYAWQEARRTAQELAQLRDLQQRQDLSTEQADGLRVREAVRSERAEALQREAERKGQEAQQRRSQLFNEKVDGVRERFPDFDATVSNPNLPFTEQIADLIAESEVGPQLAYRLAKDPAKLRAIAEMPLHRQGAEIARLEAEVSVPIRKTSNAPAPVPRVGGGSSPSGKDPANMTLAEMSAWYAKSKQRA